MSEPVVEGPFKLAVEKVEEAYEQSVSELKSSVEKAKGGALKKVST